MPNYLLHTIDILVLPEIFSLECLKLKSLSAIEVVATKRFRGRRLGGITIALKNHIVSKTEKKNKSNGFLLVAFH